ncbi:hypothetical protein N7501_002509 [Penicillium viridicatum]|nr:hypothetical protein N7501_002509 [Penicillium viridicatum]
MAGLQSSKDSSPYRMVDIGTGHDKSMARSRLDCFIATSRGVSCIFETFHGSISTTASNIIGEAIDIAAASERNN